MTNKYVRESKKYKRKLQEQHMKQTMSHSEWIAAFIMIIGLIVVSYVVASSSSHDWSLSLVIIINH